MRILVTGAAGLYGVHLVDELVKKQAVSAVIGVDNFSRGFFENNPFIKSEEFEKRFQLIRDNYQNLSTKRLDELDLDVVVHLAAYVSIDESMELPTDYFENNEIGTFGFVQNIFKTKNKPFLLYASSPEVYGNPLYTPMDIDHPLYPRSIYAVTKLACEKHINALHEWYGHPTGIIRNFNTYGENQNIWGYSAVVPHFIEKALKGEDLPLHNGGEQTRDFQYVKDAVHAYWLFIEKRKELSGECFNAGTGKQTSIEELANMIIELTGSRSKAVVTKGRSADLESLEADITETVEKLGWQPCYTLEEGLKRTIEWYKMYVK